MKTDYTREELISLCEHAIVPEEHWWDRDSHEAHKGVGGLWALLKAGCLFEINLEDTDEKCVWVRIWSRGFNDFENGEGANTLSEYYVPHATTLAEANGKDWY